MYISNKTAVLSTVHEREMVALEEEVRQGKDIQGAFSHHPYLLKPVILAKILRHW